MRLAIRAAGQGEFSIHNLIINNVSYWWNKDIKWNAQYPLSDTSYKLLLNQKHWLDGKSQIIKLFILLGTEYLNQSSKEMNLFI